MPRSSHAIEKQFEKLDCAERRVKLLQLDQENPITKGVEWLSRPLNVLENRRPEALKNISGAKSKIHSGLFIFLPLSRAWKNKHASQNCVSGSGNLRGKKRTNTLSR